MRRRATLVLLLLVLGAIVNVAVAWGLARWPEEFQSAATPVATGVSASADGCWYVVISSRFGRLNFSATPMWPERKTGSGRLGQLPSSGNYPDVSQLLPRWSHLHQPPSVRELNYRLHEQARGWPMLALRTERYYWSDRSAPPVIRNGIDIKPRSPGAWPISLPLAPIWPGFAINTVFYAFVLWLLFAAPFALRRRRRIKRGLCPACAYDLRGTPRGAATACPECGVTVANAMQQVTHTRTRFLDGKHLPFFKDSTPQEVAQRAIEQYREIASEEPEWVWPKICVAFAEQAAEVLSSPQAHADPIIAICAEFRSASKGIKGIFDLWALHDWLLDQAEAARTPKPQAPSLN